MLLGRIACVFLLCHLTELLSGKWYVNQHNNVVVVKPMKVFFFIIIFIEAFSKWSNKFLNKLLEFCCCITGDHVVGLSFL